MSNTTVRHTIKKIGFYDSGLGGLFVMSKVQKKFPHYEYVFLADEVNLPYGQKSIEELLVYARNCLNFLIQIENCDVIIIACNTLSATVYSVLSEEYHKRFPHVLLIDIITPTIDSLKTASSYTVFGTKRTIMSHVYKKEIQTRFNQSNVFEIEMNNLASLIEEKKNSSEYLVDFLPLVDTLSCVCILACTHYGIILDVFKTAFPQFTTIITQDTIMVETCAFILNTTPDPQNIASVSIYTTKKTPVFVSYAELWFPIAEVKEIVVAC